MGKLKELFLEIEDRAMDASVEAAADSWSLYQDFVMEQRDDIREHIEVTLLDALTDEGFEMDDFYQFMNWADDDDYHVWLDNLACEALDNEGIYE